MSIETLPAIDVHGHYGIYDRGKPDVINEFMSGDAALVARRAQRVHIRWTIVSPLKALLPRGGGDPVVGNQEAARDVAATDGLLQYVVVDPTNPRTYEQATEMLKLPRCVGIKIHPEEHVYPITEHGRKFFEFAARHRAIVLTHSGEQRSLPTDFVPFVNDFPEVRLILAHIGCGWDGDLTHQVRAIQQSKHGNMFADTSSARSITPKLIEYAVHEIGAERVLFGTDTPLYSTGMQRRRIDEAELSERDKRLILWDNAAKLFDIEKRFGK
jgi:predicted TIM-barrel fold metal-dependent hydrolase